MQLFIVQASHPDVSGNPLSIYDTQPAANLRAAELVNQIADDYADEVDEFSVPAANADTWRDVVDKLHKAVAHNRDADLDLDVWVMEADFAVEATTYGRAFGSMLASLTAIDKKAPFGRDDRAAPLAPSEHCVIDLMGQEILNLRNALDFAKTAEPKISASLKT